MSKTLEAKVYFDKEESKAIGLATCKFAGTLILAIVATVSIFALS